MKGEEFQSIYHILISRFVYLFENKVILLYNRCQSSNNEILAARRKKFKRNVNRGKGVSSFPA